MLVRASDRLRRPPTSGSNCREVTQEDTLNTSFCIKFLAVRLRGHDLGKGSCLAFIAAKAGI